MNIYLHTMHPTNIFTYMKRIIILFQILFQKLWIMIIKIRKDGRDPRTEWFCEDVNAVATHKILSSQLTNNCE